EAVDLVDREVDPVRAAGGRGKEHQLTRVAIGFLGRGDRDGRRITRPHDDLARARLARALRIDDAALEVVRGIEGADIAGGQDVAGGADRISVRLHASAARLRAVAEVEEERQGVAVGVRAAAQVEGHCKWPYALRWIRNRLQ